MSFKKLAVLAGVAALTLSGCAAAADDTASEATSSTEETTAAATTEEMKDIKICVYTHGDGGTFWSVAQMGAEDAGKDLGITVDYQGSINDSAKQASTIDAGIAAGCDGIAASAPDAGAIEQAMLAVNAAGIPTVTMNSGSDVFKDLG